MGERGEVGERYAHLGWGCGAVVVAVVSVGTQSGKRGNSSFSRYGRIAWAASLAGMDMGVALAGLDRACAPHGVARGERRSHRARVGQRPQPQGGNRGGVSKQFKPKWLSLKGSATLQQGRQPLGGKVTWVLQHSEGDSLFGLGGGKSILLACFFLGRVAFGVCLTLWVSYWLSWAHLAFVLCGGAGWEEEGKGVSRRGTFLK